MFDLLKDPVIPVSCLGRNSVDYVTLPELYSLLVANSVGTMPALARHQAQAWYQFLVQIGALALHGSGIEVLPSRDAEWARALAALTPGCSDTAWSLVAKDATDPALLQPPTTHLGDYKPLASTPDSLDVLVTAKNHDRKQATVRQGSPHAWLYALVTLQTSQGYSGRGNPGIARMNGGLSSRVLVDRRPSSRWGPRVVRGIRMMLHNRDEILEDPGAMLYRKEGGLALLWLQHWDTDAQISLTGLDPYFVEVCRRVRLVVNAEDCLEAIGYPAMKERVAAKQLKGNLRDPWVPVNIGKGDPTALTVSANGFNYRQVQRILFDRNLERPRALRPLPNEIGADSEIHMAVLARGQGKTEGLHERILPLPNSIASQLFVLQGEEEEEDRVTLGSLSEEMVKLAGEARKILRQAVLIFLLGPENTDFKSKGADTISGDFDRKVDARYFEHLFAAPERGSDEILEGWQRFLKELAFFQADVVWKSGSPPRARRELARARSEARLVVGLRKVLPEAFSRIDSPDGGQ